MREKRGKHVDWERELLEFAKTSPLPPPAHLTDKVTTSIRQDLRPALWKIFAKLALIQAVCATISLFFCPQFAIGFAQHDYLAGLVQHSEGFAFMFICGMIFLGSGAALAPLFINQAEMKALAGSVLIYFPIAALVAVLLFYSLGAAIYWSLALPWFSGGVLGSIIAFELSQHFRFRLRLV